MSSPSSPQSSQPSQLVESRACLALAAHPLTQQRIVGWMQRLGHTVQFVSTPAELLAHPELATCPLVIVKIFKTQQLEACRAIKARAATAHVPLAAITESSAWQQAAYDVGVQAVFGRSTSITEILARLRALLAQQQSLQWADHRVHAAERDREQIHNVFRRYVAPQLVDQILERINGDAEQISAGKRCQAAVLFADMRGFTRLAEQLPPTRVFELVNEFFSELTAAAFTHEGTVFNMAGDSLMVGFGVPVAQPDASARALRAARDMLSRFGYLAQSWQQRFGVQAGLGVGINEGEVMAGNIGCEQYMNFSLIGDTVNVAARLGQRARAGEVLFSGALKLSLGDQEVKQTPVLALPPLTLRGRQNPIDIFCVPIDKRIDLS